MQYFIMLPDDEENNALILGEESLGKFIYGSGFKVLTNIVNDHQDIIPHISIIDEQRKTYEVMEFLDLISTWKEYR